MDFIEKLEEAKSECDALITYANGVTGESDTSVGDCIASLVAGYGGGGRNVVSGTYTLPERSASLSIDTGMTDFEFFYIIKKNSALGFGERSFFTRFFMKDVFAFSIGTNSSGTTYAGVYTTPSDSSLLYNNIKVVNNNGIATLNYLGQNGGGYYQPDEYIWYAF